MVSNKLDVCQQSFSMYTLSYLPLPASCQLTNLFPFNKVGSHDNDATVLLPDHSPEVGDGRLKTALSSDVLALALRQLSILATNVT